MVTYPIIYKADDANKVIIYNQFLLGDYTKVIYYVVTEIKQLNANDFIIKHTLVPDRSFIYPTPKLNSSVNNTSTNNVSEPLFLRLYKNDKNKIVEYYCDSEGKEISTDYKSKHVLYPFYFEKGGKRDHDTALSFDDFYKFLKGSYSNLGVIDSILHRKEK